MALFFWGGFSLPFPENRAGPESKKFYTFFFLMKASLTLILLDLSNKQNFTLKLANNDSFLSQSHKLQIRLI